jgi:hypothetical protein
LIAAITEDKILGFQVMKGSVKGKDFGAFLVNLINSLPLVNSLDNYVFFMDNSKTHHAKILKTLRSYLHVVFNASFAAIKSNRGVV